MLRTVINENMYFLIVRSIEEQVEWPIDMQSIGGYTMVEVGKHKTSATKEDAIAYLKSVATQFHNQGIDRAHYIIDSNGEPIWSQWLVSVEKEY